LYRFVSNPVSDPDSNPDLKCLFLIRIRPKVSDPFGSGSPTLQKYLIIVVGDCFLYSCRSKISFFTGKLPFHDVLLHGVICDQQGRKMSKSLGKPSLQYFTDTLFSLCVLCCGSGSETFYRIRIRNKYFC